MCVHPSNSTINMRKSLSRQKSNSSKYFASSISSINNNSLHSHINNNSIGVI
jgi:hypothetical protein